MSDQPTKSRTPHVVLWGAQALLALILLPAGSMKLLLPITRLAALWPWLGEYPQLVLVDLLGGLGMVLPMLLRFKPRLVSLAALGVVVMQGCAIAFHVARGEQANTPFNFVVLALALFVCWGRRKSPVQSG